MQSMKLLIPVSYTHLDVYKRQDRDISAKPVERDPAHLKEIYEVGRRVMKADMEKLKAYLAE